MYRYFLISIFDIIGNIKYIYRCFFITIFDVINDIENVDSIKYIDVRYFIFNIDKPNHGTITILIIFYSGNDRTQYVKGMCCMYPLFYLKNKLGNLTRNVSISYSYISPLNVGLNISPLEHLKAQNIKSSFLRTLRFII